MPKYIIRPEQPTDFNTIYDLVKLAFATAPQKDGDEQDYVNKLRLKDSYLPQLALVAEQQGELIGHIMLTKTYVNTPNGQYTALLLSPICVRLEERNKGIGAALINESFKCARKLGYQAVFLVGEPTYYSRFGFRPTTDFNIHISSDIPAKYVQGVELVPNALSGISGSISIV
jgi:putative acetyltransferase